MDRQKIRKYMERCIEVAKSNDENNGLLGPKVGSIVLAKSEEVVSEGYRTFLPGTTLAAHSERMALDSAGSAAIGGTLITTLEPCLRINRRQIFSSCSELILNRGIKTVIIGALDFSKSMYHQSAVNYLRRRGLDVIEYFALLPVIKRELLTMSGSRRIENIEPTLSPDEMDLIPRIHSDSRLVTYERNRRYKKEYI